ncbi:MAG: response regulator [Vicinamibacterales bacterium]|jgi:DNA-binding response OmpR family regulator
MKILIAEDDATSRLILQATLQKAGHEVVAAENGLHAWTAWREAPCPVLISDWQMPDLDGLELCRAIRQTGNANYTYIILLTAHGGKTNYLEAMTAGADDFLTKPLDIEQLLAKLHVAERILGLRQHVKRLEGILSICSYCKKIRDDSRWRQMESYVTQHSEAQFSHGICPDCFTKVKMEAGLS